jgi:hypothetical protein
MERVKKLREFQINGFCGEFSDFIQNSTLKSKHKNLHGVPKLK